MLGWMHVEIINGWHVCVCLSVGEGFIGDSIWVKQKASPRVFLFTYILNLLIIDERVFLVVGSLYWARSRLQPSIFRILFPTYLESVPPRLFAVRAKKDSFVWCPFKRACRQDWSSPKTVAVEVVVGGCSYEVISHIFFMKNNFIWTSEAIFRIFFWVIRQNYSKKEKEKNS